MELSDEELAACLRALQHIADDPAMMQDNERFKGLVTKIYRAGRKAERRTNQQQRTSEDRALRIQVASARAQPSSTAVPEAHTMPAGRLHTPRPCYSCKKDYREVHPFYHLLCPTCAELHMQKRHQRADLTGRTALITGGRIKIGYQTALRLLHDGARVILTTRFPRDASRRFAAEPDVEAWADRLSIHGLDLRHIPSVETFTSHLLASEPALDMLINNAAQTIKRPRDFYEHLLASERSHDIPPLAQRLLAPSGRTDTPLLESLDDYRGHLPDTHAYFSPETFDEHGQALDRRPSNSWVLRLHEVGTVELLEVQLVNAIAPFLLVGQLKPLFLRSQFERRFIVNVSAMEGQFGRIDKTFYHPHTNMAKAGLNMLTRTSAADYARDGIFMNSVDTGWITDENPYEKVLHARQDRGFYTPLDSIDGMARIYDPIARGINEPSEPLSGHFLKDYQPYPW